MADLLVNAFLLPSLPAEVGHPFVFSLLPATLLSCCKCWGANKRILFPAILCPYSTLCLGLLFVLFLGDWLAMYDMACPAITKHVDRKRDTHGKNSDTSPPFLFRVRNEETKPQERKHTGRKPTLKHHASSCCALVP